MVQEAIFSQFFLIHSMSINQPRARYVIRQVDSIASCAKASRKEANKSKLCINNIADIDVKLNNYLTRCCAISIARRRKSRKLFFSIHEKVQRCRCSTIILLYGASVIKSFCLNLLLNWVNKLKVFSFSSNWNWKLIDWENHQKKNFYCSCYAKGISENCLKVESHLLEFSSRRFPRQVCCSFNYLLSSWSATSRKFKKRENYKFRITRLRCAMCMRLPHTHDTINLKHKLPREMTWEKKEFHELLDLHGTKLNQIIASHKCLHVSWFNSIQQHAEMSVFQAVTAG